jgi:hypothetical protein
LGLVRLFQPKHIHTRAFCKTDDQTSTGGNALQYGYKGNALYCGYKRCILGNFCIVGILRDRSATRVIQCGSNAGYTTFRGSVKITGYPRRSPVTPSLPPVRHHVPSHFNWTLPKTWLQRV